MLQTIREHTQGWIAGTIISIIILSFALWGIHSYFTGEGANTTVASVNGVDISKEQLTFAYQRLQRQYQSQIGTQDESNLKNRALESLIQIEVLKQASVKQGFNIFDQQIDGFLQSLPEFQESGRFSLNRFQEFLSSSLLTTNEFIDLIRTSLLIDQPKLSLAFSAFALSNETNDYISLINQEREISYAVLPFQFFLLQPSKIGSADIKTYYDQHKREFMTSEQVQLDYLELKLKDLQNKIQVSEDQLKNFYNENINSFTLPMSWKLATLEIPVDNNATTDQIKQAKIKADAIAKLVRNNEDLSTLAQHYNVELRTENNITLVQLPKELHQAVSVLNKQQPSTPALRTQKGFVVLKAIEINQSEVQAFSKIKEQVKVSYTRQHADEQFAQLRDKLADLTYEHPDTLESASKALSLPLKTTDFFTKDKSGKDISQFKKIREVAFSNDVLNLQNNSDVIQLDPETLVVVRLKNHVPARLLSLTEVSPDIQDRLKKTEAQKKATEIINSLRNQLQQGADANQILVPYQMNWVKKGYVGRYSKDVNAAIIDTAFSMTMPNSKLKSTYAIARLPNALALVVLSGVRAGELNDAKQKNLFAEQTQNAEGLVEYELYKLSAMKNAKIKM